MCAITAGFSFARIFILLFILCSRDLHIHFSSGGTQTHCCLNIYHKFTAIEHSIKDTYIYRSYLSRIDKFIMTFLNPTVTDCVTI